MKIETEIETETESERRSPVLEGVGGGDALFRVES